MNLINSLTYAICDGQLSYTGYSDNYFHPTRLQWNIKIIKMLNQAEKAYEIGFSLFVFFYRFHVSRNKRTEANVDTNREIRSAIPFQSHPTYSKSHFAFIWARRVRIRFGFHPRNERGSMHTLILSREQRS